MALVLAVEPDHRQAAILTRVIQERIMAELIVVDSRDAAIAALTARVPDVILLTALLSPRDEDEMVAHLRTLADADHVQTHTIPQLASAGIQAEAPAGSGGLLAKFRRKSKKELPPISGCDPGMFAEEVRTFLARAAELKAHAGKVVIARAPDVEAPRHEMAPAGPDTDERVSASSAWSSPFEWRRADGAAEAVEARSDAPQIAHPPLVVATPIAVAAEENEQRREGEVRTAKNRVKDQAEEKARQRAEATAKALAEEQARAAAERERVEAEAAAQHERARLEVLAAEKERERLEAIEAQRVRVAEETRIRVEAAERERVRLEAEAAERERVRVAEETRIRLAAEAAEQKRLKLEAIAAEKERARLEAVAAAEKERARLEAIAAGERERVRLEAEAAAERERVRLEAEAAAARERARLAEETRIRLEAEAAERERVRLETIAAEKERARLEAVAAAERERVRLEAVATAERERVRLEAEAAAAREQERLEAAAEVEREQRRIEEAAAARVRARTEREKQVMEAVAAARAADPFAEFRIGPNETPSLLRLMPLAFWARRESTAAERRLPVAGLTAAPPAAETPADELRDLMAGLSLSPQVAGVSYGRGCRIRRVRVPASAAIPRMQGAGPVIVSKRALEQVRAGG